MKHPRIVIAGAGSIGCFIGGHLASAGHSVTFLARDRVISEINENGLTVTDLAGASRHVAADQLGLSETPDCLTGADLILVTVKSGATAEIADLIQTHAPASAPVISLQNGLFGIETLTAALAERDVRAGMVGFNVVPTGDGVYHRATSGHISIGNGPVDLADILTTPQLVITETPDITAIQWGKLLLNLNNAPNALSGLPLYDMMLDRNWRCIMADQMSESLRVLKAAKLSVISATPAPVSMMPHILRLPTPLFRRIAAKMLTFDPSARSSMSYDLMAGRLTEVDYLQGAIIALGQRHEIATPLNIRLRDLIHRAETAGKGPPNLTAQDVRNTKLT